MQITPITNTQTNPNFKQLRVTKKTLKALNCTKEDILKNDFIRKWSKKYDICIWRENPFNLKMEDDFSFVAGKDFHKPFFSRKANIQCFTEIRKFKDIDDLDRVVSESEDEFYKEYAIDEYLEEWIMMDRAVKGEYSSYALRGFMPILMRGIASIPRTRETEELHKYFMEKLQKLEVWTPLLDKMSKNPKDLANADVELKYADLHNLDMSKSPARLALENNNLELLEFLKSKGENMNDCLDLMKEGKVTDEAKEILKDVKYQDEKIFRLFECGGSDYLRRRFLENNSNIDINSRDKNGDTLVTKAVKENNLKMIKFLSTIEDVKWNACDKEGRNIMLIILERGTVFDEKSGIIGFIKTNLKDKFDINAPSCTHEYISKDPISPLEYCLLKDSSWLNLLLGFENLNVLAPVKNSRLRIKDTPLVTYPTMYQDLDLEMFQKMLNHPSCDTNKNPDAVKATLNHSIGTKYHKSVQNLIPQLIINNVREIYDRNGVLTLEEINTALEAFRDIENLNSVSLNLKVNNVGDTLVHMLADISVDINDFETMTKMSQVLEKFQEGAGMDTLMFTNLSGQTVLDKAIEAENTGLVRLIADIFPTVKSNPLYLKTRTTNKEIQKILRGEE